VAPLHSEHLVEIAIVNLATPADAQSGAAHQVFDRGWIEVSSK
jgi:hypothetical protein